MASVGMMGVTVTEDCTPRARATCWELVQDWPAVPPIVHVWYEEDWVVDSATDEADERIVYEVTEGSNAGEMTPSVVADPRVIGTVKNDRSN